MCMRFSDWSNTIDPGGLEDLFGHLEAVHAVGCEQLLALRRLAIVKRGQAVHELRLRIPRRRHQRGVDLVRREEGDPLPHFAGGSPRDTHTSVYTKSHPATAAFGSSDRVIRAELAAASERAFATTGSKGQRALGAQSRTSIPIAAPPSRSEFPMLLRASPR